MAPGTAKGFREKQARDHIYACGKISPLQGGFNISKKKKKKRIYLGAFEDQLLPRRDATFRALSINCI